MNLNEWCSNYIDYLNSFKRSLKYKEIKEDRIICDMIDGKYVYKISEKLTVDDVDCIVCLNNRENLKFLIENWEKFVKYQKLKIIFSNPKENLQWSILPYLHNRFTDPVALKTGLKSLFDSVPKIK